MDRQELERLTREQLIAQAERLGIPRPRVLTQPELIDEIIGRTARSEREKQKARGWLGRARDLLARVVERGLHLPEAARVLRSTPEERPWPTPPPPLPTVTLAEIYAAQGHLERAISVLDEVLGREPDHQEARALRSRFAEQARARSRAGRGAVAEAPPAPAPPVEKQEEPPITPSEPAVTPAPLETPAEAAPSEEAPPITVASTGQAEAKEAPAPAATVATKETAEELGEAEAAALPERYDVDEIVAIAVDPRTIYLYWEARATTLAHAQARRSDGWLCLRIVSVTASWSGPVVKVRDTRIDALYGDRFVREVEPGSNVRVSVGWMAGGEFEPFAVGIEVTVPHLAPTAVVAHETAVWEPVGSRPSPWADAPALSALPLPFAAHPPPPRLAPPVHEGAARPSAERAPPPRWPRRTATAAPVDTGVEVWGDAPRAPRADEVALSQLRSWPKPGGASDLPRGGASELARWAC